MTTTVEKQSQNLNEQNLKMEVNNLQAKKQELERTIHQQQNHKKHQELLHQ